MMVKELIKNLQYYPKDLEVRIGTIGRDGLSGMPRDLNTKDIVREDEDTLVLG